MSNETNNSDYKVLKLNLMINIAGNSMFIDGKLQYGFDIIMDIFVERNNDIIECSIYRDTIEIVEIVHNSLWSL